MRTFLVALLSFGMLCMKGYATPSEGEMASTPWYLKATPEVRVSYFHFSNAIPSAICGDGTINYQVGATYPFYYGTKIWASVSHLHGQGQSLDERDLTTIDITPINLGLRYGEWDIPFYGKGYIQVGPSYYHMSIHNDTDFVRKTFHKNGPGVFFGTGGVWDVKSNLQMNLFVEYSHRWCNHIRKDESTTRRHFNMNGWDFGGGFRYVF